LLDAVATSTGSLFNRLYYRGNDVTQAEIDTRAIELAKEAITRIASHEKHCIMTNRMIMESQHEIKNLIKNSDAAL